ncbi:chromosomal replication initiator DnaA [Aurantimonas aggregata]|uniref:Chromosomal replication initiator DnaA n=1 Tax=Aurantimonas aggregata TaxID=2047720 RepID=A0A6L9MJV0_9HYPH|nr:helix-turn-helix domain-containing protein [Aurantimonas aggregata]NDV87750.1 chromosomal replication initiator DnaA [Aurantimonas aggregata]
MQSPDGDVLGAAAGHGAGPVFLRLATCRNRLACRLAREIASAFFAVPVPAIASPNRAVAPVCEARHVAMYLAHVVFQVPLAAIAGAFGRDRTSVAHAVRRIEDRRDDRVFDAMLTRLEGLAHAVRLALEQVPDDAHDAGVAR